MPIKLLAALFIPAALWSQAASPFEEDQDRNGEISGKSGAAAGLEDRLLPPDATGGSVIPEVSARTQDRPISGVVSVRELQHPVPKKARDAARQAARYSEEHNTAKAIEKLEQAVRIDPLSDNTRGLGSVTGRLGYTWGPTLLYVKGGAGFRDGGDATATIAGVPTAVAANNTTVGYTIGAGLEYMFAPNWSAKAEYQYYNFGNTSFTTPVSNVAFNRDVNTVKLGVNYRFNLGGPVVAKY